MSDSVYSNRGLYSQNNPQNVFDFIVRSTIKSMVNTALPVLVQKVYRGDESCAGYVQVLPLVMPRDSRNNSIRTVSIPKLPYFRLYAGRAAIVCDPVPGDIGLAVFAQQDSTLVKAGTKEPQPAGTFRCYDMSDGFYIGGFLGGNGDTRIIFDQEGNITIDAPQTITVNCTTANVNASESVNIDTPETNVSGLLHVQGQIIGKGGMAISGGSGASVNGNLAVQEGDVTADDISLKNHTHGGVTGGGDSTSVAQ